MAVETKPAAPAHGAVESQLLVSVGQRRGPGTDVAVGFHAVILRVVRWEQVETVYLTVIGIDIYCVWYLGTSLLVCFPEGIGARP